jgi:hypothetical protein
VPNSCGHRICSEDLLRVNGRCPKCRKVFDLKKDSIPTDHDLLQIIEAVSASLQGFSPVEESLDQCDTHEESKASGKCSCGLMLCTVCIAVHRKKGHTVRDVHQLLPLRCAKHKEEFKLFCFPCKSLICLICFVSHKQHDIIELSDAAELARRDADKLMLASRNRNQLVLGAINKIHSEEVDLQELEGKLCTEIDTAMDSIIAQLQEKRQSLKNDLVEHCQRRKKNLSEMRAVLEKDSVQMTEWCEAMQKSLSSGDGTHIIQSRDQLGLVIDNSLRAPLEVERLDIKFVNSIQTAVSSLDELSFIEVTTVDPQKCAASGSGLSAVSHPNLSGEFQIESRCSKGKLLDNRSLHFEVKVTGSPEWKEDAVIDSNYIGEGIWKYRFTLPKEAVIGSKYVISASIFGSQIQQSPFSGRVQANQVAELSCRVRGASSKYNDSRSPDNVLKRDDSLWVLGNGQLSGWIIFELKETGRISELHVNNYASAGMRSAVLETSLDMESWFRIKSFTAPAGDSKTYSKIDLDGNHPCKFVRVSFSDSYPGNPQTCINGMILKGYSP